MTASEPSRPSGAAEEISLSCRILDDIQAYLFQRACQFRDAHTRTVDDRNEFYSWFTPENLAKPEIHGGFAMSHWCGEEACEAKIKADLNVSIRCIPIAAQKEPGTCICCGKPSNARVVFAKAY